MRRTVPRIVAGGDGQSAAESLDHECVLIGMPVADSAIRTAAEQEADVVVLVAQRRVEGRQPDGGETAGPRQFERRTSWQFRVIRGQTQDVGADRHAGFLRVPAGVRILSRGRKDVHHIAQPARAAGLAVAEWTVLVIRRRCVQAIIRRVAKERLLHQIDPGRFAQRHDIVQGKLHVRAPIAGTFLPAAVVAAPGGVGCGIEQRGVLEPLPRFGPLVDK